MLKTKSTTASVEAGHISVIPNTPTKFLWFAVKPFKWWFFATFSVIVLAAALDQGTSYLFKLIVDAVETGEADAVFFYILAFPVVVLTIQMLFRFSGFLTMKCVTGATKYANDEMVKYVLGHSHAYFSNRFAGSLMTKFGNTSGAIDRIIPQVLWSHLTTLVSFIVTFVLIFLVDITSALLFAVLAVVLIVFNRKLAPGKHRLSKIRAEARTALGGKTIDVLTNVAAVRQYVRGASEVSAVQELTLTEKNARQKNWMYTERMLMYNTLILFLFGSLMFWSLANGWSAGEVSSGDLILVLTLISYMTGTLVFIGRSIDEVAQALGEMEEGLEDLLVPHEIVDAKDAKPLVAEQASISFEHVDFKFENNQVFKDFGLVIEPGQRLGLVGQSGAGKTTFVSLLLRQHDLDGGVITIDGQDISKVTQDSLREHIAVVPQEPLLFHRTIRENIEYGKSGATDEEIIEVAKKAQAHDFISELSDGYDTLVGERGIKLSGGQKQRVAIARAMLKDAPILVLDEATSALDSESEVAIQRALEALMEGRTVIAIAHRLSTLRKMDRIVVMENGEIIEDGNHESLAEGGGVYERLWNHQAGGFLQE